MNELIYQQGGTLILDEPFEAQPTAATITITDLSNQQLSVLGDFTDVEDEAADLDDLVLTLPATNEQARLITPSATAGTIPTITSKGYRLLLNRGGRLYWATVNEYDSAMGSVTSVKLDSPLPFALKAGDTAKGIRVSYSLDWSAVTSTFVGRVKAIWKVTVGGSVQKITKIYDVVRQTFPQPATWADVLDLRPDADTQLSHIADKEALVTKAWRDIKQELYTMGIRHNLVVADDSTSLKDATVLQCIYNLSTHSNLPVPTAYNGVGDTYLDRLKRDKEKALSMLQMPVDENEDLIISPKEENIRRLTVFFRSPVNHRQES